MRATVPDRQGREDPTYADAVRTRASAERICARSEIELAIDRLAAAVDADIGADNPVLLCVMNGGLPFTAALLARLERPLEVDYLHATRYHGTSSSDITWKHFPERNLAGRHVLVVDDVLDAGITLAAVLERVRAFGTASVRAAVLVDKQLPGRVTRADYVALNGPDRYLFGWGMDYHGYWRNLMDIWAVANGHSDPQAEGEG